MEKESIVMHEQEPEIIIEAATPEDAAGIGVVQREGWLTTYPNVELGITEEVIVSRGFIGDKQRAERIRTQRDAKVWVAKDGDRVVGFSVASLGEKMNKVGALYILSEYRGKGIGKKLMQQALDWLGNEKDICLGVVYYNDNAISFYERFGFERGAAVVHETPTFPLVGKDLPEIEMILRRGGAGEKK